MWSLNEVCYDIGIKLKAVSRMLMKNTLEAKMRTAFSLIFIVIISLVGMIMFHMINQSFRTHSDQTLGHVVEANLDLLHNHLDNLDRFTN